ncbi:MAG: class I SAM-dependent methyltransferase, partial [Rhodospirillales bacterium]
MGWLLGMGGNYPAQETGATRNTNILRIPSAVGYHVPMAYTYSPRIFDAPSLEAAMRIILTPQGGQDSEERWKRETPYLAELIGQAAGLSQGQLVLDYGCGIGRLAKELMGRFGVRVVGVDISRNMRSLAPVYVDSDAFCSVSPVILDTLIAQGVRFDAALSIWVLQHCARPLQDIARIHAALCDGGQLMAVNGIGRAVPTREGKWANDGIDIRKELHDRLEHVDSGQLDPAIVGDN